HEEVDGDDFFIELGDVGSHMQPLVIAIFRAAVVKSGDVPDVVQLTGGRDFHGKNSAAVVILLENYRASPIADHGDGVIGVVVLGDLVTREQQCRLVTVARRH